MKNERYYLHDKIKPYYKLDVKNRTIYIDPNDSRKTSKYGYVRTLKYVNLLREKYGYNLQLVLC